MTIKRLIKLLMKHKIEFSFEWDDGGENYYLDVILGNVEHLIDPKDNQKLEELWTEIETYWLY